MTTDMGMQHYFTSYRRTLLPRASLAQARQAFFAPSLRERRMIPSGVIVAIQID